MRERIKKKFPLLCRRKRSKQEKILFNNIIITKRDAEKKDAKHFLTFTYFLSASYLLDSFFLLLTPFPFQLAPRFMLKRLQKLLRVLATEHSSKRLFLRVFNRVSLCCCRIVTLELGNRTKKKLFCFSLFFFVWIMEKFYLFSMGLRHD